MMERSRSLRAQFNRATNNGIRVERLQTADIAQEAEFSRVLAARGPAGLSGFLVPSPVAVRNGYPIEQIARLPDAPNGASELMIDAAMRLFAEKGCAYATLGLVALSCNAEEGLRKNPLSPRRATNTRCGRR